MQAILSSIEGLGILIRYPVSRTCLCAPWIVRTVGGLGENPWDSIYRTKIGIKMAPPVLFLDVTLWFASHPLSWRYPLQSPKLWDGGLLVIRRSGEPSLSYEKRLLLTFPSFIAQAVGYSS